MRLWIIVLIAVGFLCVGIKILQTVKFDAAVVVSVKKGALKGLSLKLLHYKVSYNDLQVRHDFWESKTGKAVFNQLSIALQMVVMASKKYVDVEFNVNYWGLLRRHYKVVEDDGNFDIVAI
ncbi:hypothetical protein KBC04_05695 [Candidatus Babeliales bacterium]|nr:hypothetical protein [Candidatus Babeliales bacterium]MBP9844222.1 hypothetical protein [Candidatus Babeliales bacterium]